MVLTYYFKDVTLLITHYNRSASLERLLKKCAELNCSFEDIVVSDDCSDPVQLELVKNLQKQYNFRLVTSAENKGLGHNLNKGQDAVKTLYTLYVQEDFVPYPAFGEHFKDAIDIINKRADIDIIRFYSYFLYPYREPYEKGYSELIFKPWSLNYLKIHYYSDHPHLRRSTFLNKFGRYNEGRHSDRTEYLMSMSFIQKKGKAMYFDNYQSLFCQINTNIEPSTVSRGKYTLSKNPFIAFIRYIYRQIKHNYDIHFLNTEADILTEQAQPDKNPVSPAPFSFHNKLFYKIIGLYVRMRYNKVGQDLRYFYKETFYCRLVQLKYIVSDYFIKKKYKTISFKGEFAPELQFVLPFAYWHFKNGTLKKTQSSKYTRELYFFSPEHEEKFDNRTHDGNSNYEMPRILYSQDYNMHKWARVPLKETYRNDIYVYEKPILIIANRYNMEWSGPPVSFFSIPVLSFIIEKLKDQYTIIYNRPKQQNIITDDSVIYDLNEFEWLAKEHPEVILIEDLFKENKGNANNFNHLQLMVYANADRFISTHGGTATLASYFGGINLIFSKQGPEHHFRCYEKLYPKLSGATIFHAKTEEELKAYIGNYYHTPHK